VCENGKCAGCDFNATSKEDKCPEPNDDDSWYRCTDNGVCEIMDDQGLSGGGIAGIIIGAVVLLGFVVGLTLYCCKREKEPQH
jgi:hypothetical protein